MWTFSNLANDWQNEVFKSKQEAIEAGMSTFDDDFLIGELVGVSYLTFAVKNVERIEMGVFI